MTQILVGMLNLKGDQLIFQPLGGGHIGQKLIILEDGATFEIQLGAVWIPGELRVEYEPSSDKIAWLHFVTREGNRCGFVPGMAARLFHEGG